MDEVNYLSLSQFIDDVVGDVKDAFQLDSLQEERFRYTFSSVAVNDILYDNDNTYSCLDDHKLYSVSSAKRWPSFNLSLALEWAQLPICLPKDDVIPFTDIPINLDIKEQAAKLKEELSAAYSYKKVKL